MRKIIDKLCNFIWEIRFAFADGARHRNFWKEEESIFYKARHSPWNSGNKENIYYSGK